MLTRHRVVPIREYLWQRLVDVDRQTVSWKVQSHSQQSEVRSQKSIVHEGDLLEGTMVVQPANQKWPYRTLPHVYLRVLRPLLLQSKSTILLSQVFVAFRS
jgi:hypothetical protein